MQRPLNEIVSEILGANDIVDVLGQYLQLKPAGGSRFKALCPFHVEKTPSFTVNRDRQTYKCFGCEKGGDAITFLQEHEGLIFREALQKLADRAGLPLPDFRGGGSAKDGERTQVLELGKVAARFYRDLLTSPLKGEAGRAYLATRKLKEETVKRFGLGYVPEGWNALLDHARTEKISGEILETAGLAKNGEQGRRYDFFRNRLMIPIRDVAGNVVAFGGRDLGDSPAKYINSPENIVYKKSNVLYGLFEGRDTMRKAKRALLVEGYFDVLRCFDAGIELAVAPCGTALTPQQAKLIARYVPEVVVVFDGDDAGIRAALKGIGILAAAGLTVRALTLPDGQDPDDYILEHGVEPFERLVEEAPDFVSFYVQTNRQRTRSIEGRSEIAREMFAIFTTMDDEIRRNEYVRHLASELGVEQGSCLREFANFIRNGQPQRAHDVEPEKSYSAPLHDEVVFIAHLLNDAGLIQHAREEIGDNFDASTPVGEVLSALLSGVSFQGVQALHSEAARALYAGAAGLADEALENNGRDTVSEWIKMLQETHLNQQGARLQEEIEQAQHSDDSSVVFELVQRKVAIQVRIDRIRSALT